MDLGGGLGVIGGIFFAGGGFSVKRSSSRLDVIGGRHNLTAAEKTAGAAAAVGG